MRRLEITSDTEYKARNIRGFCHLYDGQEAVAMGVQAALDNKDNWITSYRCHCIAYLRGVSPAAVLGELLGLDTGCTYARGGSMHLYNKENNFYGGQGIYTPQFFAPTVNPRIPILQYDRRSQINGWCEELRSVVLLVLKYRLVLDWDLQIGITEKGMSRCPFRLPRTETAPLTRVKFGSL